MNAYVVTMSPTGSTQGLKRMTLADAERLLAYVTWNMPHSPTARIIPAD